MKKNLSKVGMGVFLLVVLSGCVSPVYDTLPDLPKYPEAQTKFDTSAIIDYREDVDPLFNNTIYTLLQKNGYSNALKPVRFRGHDFSQTRVLQLLHVKFTNYNCEDGHYLETRVILLVRSPGEVWSGKLNYSGSRYFQAYSRFKLEGDEITSEERERGVVEALENAFRISEFRKALEPHNAAAPVLKLTGVSKDDFWQRSLAQQQAGNMPDAIYSAWLAADKDHPQARKYLLDQVMYSSVLRADDLFALVSKSAEVDGLAEVQNKLGLMYLNGVGIKQDDAKAYYWFKRAADQNFASAQLNVGYCYEHGYGVAKDIDKAIEWYRTAAANGSKTAQRRLKNLTQK